MGKKSRLKRQRMAGEAPGKLSEARQKAAALFLQEHGASLGQGIDDFASAARSDGHLQIRRRLLANHNLRMVRTGRLPPPYLEQCWKPIRYLTLHYSGLRKIGYDEDAHPAAFVGQWPDHLRWGLDSIQQAVRLLLAGQLIGASVIARSQLERWTGNRANNIKFSRLPGESTSAFADRVWKGRTFDQLRFRSDETDDVIDGKRLQVGDIMEGLSKNIHAEHNAATIGWANSAFEDFTDEAVDAARLVSDALVLVSRQLGIAVAALLAEKGHHGAARAVATFHPPIPRTGIAPLPGALWPANMLLIQGPAAIPVHRMAARFDALQLKPSSVRPRNSDSELMLFCFTHYRSRCIRHAETAFLAEEKMLGRRLTQDHLSRNEFPPVITSEMAASLSSWLPAGSYPRAAAGAIADALRGTYWLWLEDDMRSMATLRVVLEQAARLRVWRLKPQHGSRLEANGTPTRWLQKAGWARLSSLNLALGELSHYREDVKWGAAFELLALLNPSVTREEAPFTARRHALEAVTRLVNHELREYISALNPDVGLALDTIAEEIFAGGTQVQKQLDDYLNHVQSYRSFQFPQRSEWQGPASR